MSNYSDKAYAKVNIFLKIAGIRDNYHLLVSRFCRVKNLYDVISFEDGIFNDFTLEGNFGCETEQNTIYKAYLKLCDLSKDVEKYFKTHKVIVDKKIPEFAGLGGGSSNCATFILMVNDICSLGLSKDKLAKIGASIGADVPFFIYEYDSANVTGIGEVVEEFKEDLLDIEVMTPKIKCDTGAIFRSFRKNFYKEIDTNEANRLLSMKSIDILDELSCEDANDLYLPAVDCEPRILIQNSKFKIKHYFSGSGSSFFTISL
jgi:4-diphosphocytidyl-2-C-methyl-D-erythritol kinase